MSISHITHKTTVFNGSVPKPQPIFTSIKPVITHEKNDQSASIRVDAQYHVDAQDTRALRLLQDIRKSKVQKITIEEPKFSSSFTFEEATYIKTHCRGIGISVEEVYIDDTLRTEHLERDPDVFVPRTPPINRDLIFPEVYSRREEPVAPSPDEYFSLQALDDYSSRRKPVTHSQTVPLASAPVLSQFFPDDDPSKSGLPPKIQALFEDESWFVEINDKEFTEAELEQIKEICAKKDISLFHKTTL